MHSTTEEYTFCSIMHYTVVTPLALPVSPCSSFGRVDLHSSDFKPVLHEQKNSEVRRCSWVETQAGGVHSLHRICLWQHNPLFSGRITDEIFIFILLGVPAQQKAIGGVNDLDVFTAAGQEGKRGVDHRPASPRHIGEMARFEGLAVGYPVVEEAGQGLMCLPAEGRVGAEGEPWFGHALEAAERAVGHPGEDVGDEVLGEDAGIRRGQQHIPETLVHPV